MKNQRKIFVYIATSLDGYIAKKDDDISFLDSVEQEGEDYGYAEFIKEIDTIIMGRKTYDKILSMDIPYLDKNKKMYVITRQLKMDEGNVTFYNGTLPGLIQQLKEAPGKNVFVDGGAEVIDCLMKYKLIDEYIISIIPHFLGDGIRLFKDGRPEEQLEFISSKSFPKGLVQLHYKSKE